MSTVAASALDERDAEILAGRIESIEGDLMPRVGDFVRFADGIERRVAFVTPAEWLPECDSVQTTDGGSFYLGDDYVSFSGSLHPGVKHGSLTLSAEQRTGAVWIFHHDYWRANNGVPAEAPFRVYECSGVAPH